MDKNPVDPLKTWFEDFKVRHRVVLMRAPGEPPVPPVPPAPADGIVSRVRELFVDLFPEESRGRRRILRVSGARSCLWIWGRVRSAPVCRDGHDRTTIDALDRRGKTVPIAAIDRSCRTVHVLLDPTSARPFLVEADRRFVPRLADAIVGASLLAILRDGGGEALVGCEVADRIEAFMKSRPDPAPPAQLAPLASAAPVLPPEASPRARAEAELAAIRRMVERRALAEIRFTGADIVGIANPAHEGSLRGRGGVQFRFILGLARGRARLYYGPPSRDPADCQRPACLGAGEQILQNLERQGDLYGLIDFILGFLATNRVAALPPAPEETPCCPADAEEEGPYDASA